ncbi:MAG: hypothetical protein O7B81_16150 [Gammaproteobacteria bacterium]|nr:hypothetical protein [Gammaproteobacteria bacterium]
MRIQSAAASDEAGNAASVSATAWVFAVTLAILASGAFISLPFGKAIVGGLRVLDGEVPYRDFWSMYAPGQFYVVAALMGVFGREIIAQGLAAAGLLAVALTIEYRIALRLGAPPRLAFGLAVALATVLWHPGLELTSWVVAVPLMMWAWSCAIRYLQTGVVRHLVVAGVCLGCAAWFKHDVAAYTTIGIGAGLLLAGLVSHELRRAGPRAALHAPLIVGLTALLCVLPVVLALAIFAGPEAWTDLVVFPAGDYRGVRTEGFPPIAPDFAALIEWLRSPLDASAARRAILSYHNWASSRIPEAVLAACLVVLPFWRGLTGRAPSGPTLLLVASMPLFWLAALLHGNTHIDTLALLCGLLAASGWVAAASFPRHRTLLRGALAGAIAVYWVGAACVPLSDAASLVIRDGPLRTLGLPGVSGVLVPEHRRAIYGPIAAYVTANVPEDQPIYVGVWRHDAIVITDMRFLYITGRRNASGHHELHPAVTDLEHVQRKIIDEIETAGVRYAVLWKFGWGDALLDEIVARRASKVQGVGATISSSTSVIISSRCSKWMNTWSCGA